MAGDDLKEHAASSHDFYDLLGVTFETSESDIRRAYRKAALKYHPDKNAGKPEVVEKFHLLQIAYDVLSDPTVKALYDNARRAKREKEERDLAFQGKRKQMKDDLERRESAFLKRKRDDDDAQAQFDRELRRLAEDGARRRKEMQDKISRQRLEEEERLDRQQNGQPAPSDATTASTPKGETAVPEMDRAVKVRWAREGSAQDMDKDSLAALFQIFGPVEHAFLLKDKKKRIGQEKSKTLIATGVVVFRSVVGAHAAVEDFEKQTGAEFSSFDSVYWAGDKQPDFIPSVTSTPVRRPNTPGVDDSPGITTPKPKERGAWPGNASPGVHKDLRKVPSFASFKTPQASPANSTSSAQTPNLEEITLIRLKNAEKRRQEERRRQEEEIRASEAAEEAAEAEKS